MRSRIPVPVKYKVGNVVVETRQIAARVKRRLRSVRAAIPPRIQVGVTKTAPSEIRTPRKDAYRFLCVICRMSFTSQNAQAQHLWDKHHRGQPPKCRARAKPVSATQSASSKSSGKKQGARKLGRLRGSSEELELAPYKPRSHENYGQYGPSTKKSGRRGSGENYGILGPSTVQMTSRKSPNPYRRAQGKGMCRFCDPPSPAIPGEDTCYAHHNK